MSVLEGKKGRWLGPVADSAIRDAEKQLGVAFPPEFRQFLARYGSGIVGSLEIYGLGAGRGVPNLLWLVGDLAEIGLHRPIQVLPFHAEGDGDYSAILAEPLAGWPAGAVVYWSPRRDKVLDIRPAFDSLEEWFSARLS